MTQIRCPLRTGWPVCIVKQMPGLQAGEGPGQGFAAETAQYAAKMLRGRTQKPTERSERSLIFGFSGAGEFVFHYTMDNGTSAEM